MSLADLISGDSGARCSRAGCTARPVDRIEWRNPKIHDASRTKVWLACARHTSFLQAFLHNRAFPVDVTAFASDDSGPDESNERDVKIGRQDTGQ